jgi:hypothetical protein
MAKRILIVLTGGLVLAGCVYEEEPAPRIISIPALREEAAPAPAPPEISEPSPPADPVPADIPGAWIPPAGRQRHWTAIVVHHSATPAGNAAIFDQWHREGRQWDGIGYDFVIGNGTDSPDGAVETTFRWTEQRAGAHTGGTPGNWANEEAVGICLVGDFNQDQPTAAQMKSLARLIRFLQQRYSIPRERIYGHGTTPGARATDCPGNNFPMSNLLAMLDARYPAAVSRGK